MPGWAAFWSLAGVTAPLFVTLTAGAGATAGTVTIEGSLGGLLFAGVTRALLWMTTSGSGIPEASKVEGGLGGLVLP